MRSSNVDLATGSPTTSVMPGPTSSCRYCGERGAGSPWTSRAGITKSGERSTLAPPDPIPEVFFGGASSIAEDIAARNVDVYLLWGEPPAMARERIERVREKAAAQGRAIRFGMRLHVITRDTEREAWAEANRLLDTMDPALIDAAQQLLKKSESVGQQRMRSLHAGSREDLEVSPNLWAGIGLVRPGVGTALVGSHEQVAERIFEYHELGLEEFILSGHPHLEEAYAVGEGVLPLVVTTADRQPRTDPHSRPWGVRHQSPELIPVGKELTPSTPSPMVRTTAPDQRVRGAYQLVAGRIREFIGYGWRRHGGSSAHASSSA